MDEEWVPVVDIPRPGGWQRIADTMGFHYTDPYLMQRVDARRRQRRSEGLARQIRLDSPPDLTPADIGELIDKIDEMIEVLSRARPIQAPPRPEPRPDPRPPTRNGRTGKGGVQLP